MKDLNSKEIKVVSGGISNNGIKSSWPEGVRSVLVDGNFRSLIEIFISDINNQLRDANMQHTCIAKALEIHPRAEGARYGLSNATEHFSIYRACMLESFL
ncbi:hypothetical protein HGB13_00235 [bacterium]|nr:hypothetical protein [bacterium]